MLPGEYLQELETALNEYRYTDVRQLTRQIAPSTFTIREVKKALHLLRRKRCFEDLELVADVFLSAGHDVHIIKRQRAQALLDQGRVDHALQNLIALAETAAKDPIEGPEVRGLIGRAYKQLFVNEGDADNLRRSLDFYLEDWQARRGGYRWQGINVVSLLARAKENSIAVGADLDARVIARNILDDIEDNGVGGVWDYATGMEAAIALGDSNAALNWARKYVTHPDADAFEIASTRRQLREIWLLEGRPLGNQLLPVLEFALLQRQGGSLDMLQPRLQDTSGFEAVYGADSVFHMQWMDTLIRQCLAVARIIHSATGEAFGTGFLVKGSCLCPQWGEAPVLVTNAHVCSNNLQDEAPLQPGTATAEFTRLADRPKTNLGDLLYSSPRSTLDISVLRIEPPPEAIVLAPIPYHPTLPKPEDRSQRIYVVGHAGGAELAVSMYDNDLANYVPPYVHYRSPTEGGSSGSPVFNRQLGLFAVHHKALEAEMVNEGILFEHILAATKKITLHPASCT